MNSLLTRQRAPLLELLKADKRAAVSLKEVREALPKAPAKPHKRPPRKKIEAQMVSGSGFWLKTPPYDGQGQGASGDARANPDGFAGNYTLQVQGGGSSSSAWAGLAINFFATEDNIFQRFAALVEYDYWWLDFSDLDTAHNDAATNIWIWGFTENRWVCQQRGLSPSWTDGTSWYEQHGSGGDGSEQIGTQSLEVFFPAFGGNWYQAWVWSWGSCDDANDFGANSSAAQWQNLQVPFVVFGSL